MPWRLWVGRDILGLWLSFDCAYCELEDEYGDGELGGEDGDEGRGEGHSLLVPSLVGTDGQVVRWRWILVEEIAIRLGLLHLGLFAPYQLAVRYPYEFAIERVD